MTADPKRIDELERDMVAAADRRAAATLAGVSRAVLEYYAEVSGARPDPSTRGVRPYHRRSWT